MTNKVLNAIEKVFILYDLPVLSYPGNRIIYCAGNIYTALLCSLPPLIAIVICSEPHFIGQPNRFRILLILHRQQIQAFGVKSCGSSRCFFASSDLHSKSKLLTVTTQHRLRTIKTLFESINCPFNFIHLPSPHFFATIAIRSF